MHTQLLTPLQQQITPHSVKCLFEIDKDNPQLLVLKPGLVDQMLQGKQGIQCAMTLTETTLRGGTQPMLFNQ
jgi:hypothetical protein